MLATLRVLDFSNQVLAIASEIKRSLAARVELCDLYQAGWLGLLDARAKFDPQRCVRFSTYARFRIRGAILDSLRREDYLSRSSRRRWRAMQAAAQRISQATGATPSDQEVAQACGETLEEVGRLRHVGRLATDLVHLPDDRIEPAEQAVYRTELLQAMRGVDLPRRQVRVLNLHYWNELPLKKIGVLLGVSESRVSQIHAAAIRKVREGLETSVAPARV